MKAKLRVYRCAHTGREAGARTGCETGFTGCSFIIPLLPTTVLAQNYLVIGDRDPYLEWCLSPTIQPQARQDRCVRPTRALSIIYRPVLSIIHLFLMPYPHFPIVEKVHSLNLQYILIQDSFYRYVMLIPLRRKTSPLD